MSTDTGAGTLESASSGAPPPEREVRKTHRVVIRFAGDSGDGMQLAGDRFTSEAAAFGNDLATLPNFPAEIRAPAGTLPGVSSFQLHFADYDILTPGDRPDVLVAMNPAALKANLPDLPHGGMLIVNTDEFTKRNLTKVGYESNPMEDDSLAPYTVHEVAMATLTRGALAPTGMSKKDAERAKNMFALGLLSWMYHRGTADTEAFLREKFARKPELAEANILAFHAGWNYGETTESFAVTYEVAPAALDEGTYRQITGNLALAYGIVAAGHSPGCRCSSGPIRSRRRPTSCTSSASTRASVSRRSRPRTRSRASARRWVPRSVARWASPPPPGPAWRSRARRSGWRWPSSCRC